ncbi:hypothetical protein [Streptomyces phytophilus]|uniref:hypothetical protein n=1 Tax=Streptomyces phytophilus TaxID=722715 RepID=UPI0015F08534|nr:hypothetical protein [Streptomyces phytophilus]
MTDRPTASTITDAQLDALHERLTAAEAVVRRLDQMATAWEQRLPETIRTPAVVAAIRAATERAPAAATDLPERRDCGARPETETEAEAKTLGGVGPCVLLHGHADPEHEDPNGVRWSLLRQSPQTAAASPPPDAPGTGPDGRESAEHPLPGVQQCPEGEIGAQTGAQSLAPHEISESLYVCPAALQVESPTHGGFDTCCDRPDLHVPVPTGPGTDALSRALDALSAPSGDSDAADEDDAPQPGGETCCVCGTTERLYWRGAGSRRPYCADCEACDCGQNPCVRLGINDPEVSANPAGCGPECAEQHTYTNGCEAAPAPPADALSAELFRVIFPAILGPPAGAHPTVVAAELADAVLPVVQAELDRRAALHADTERRLRADLAAEVQKREAAEATTERVRQLHRPYDDNREQIKRCVTCASREAYPNGVAIHEPWPCPTYRATEPPKETKPMTDTTCNATITGPHILDNGTLHCTRTAGHGGNHTGPDTDHGQTLWTDNHAGATPHTDAPEAG